MKTRTRHFKGKLADLPAALQVGEAKARDMCYRDARGEEAWILDLACAIERSKNPNYSVVSWASQVEAAAFHAAHGAVATIKRLVELDG